MRDLDPGLRPNASPTAPPIEAAQLLGEDVVQSITDKIEMIGQLGVLAKTANPFNRDDPPVEVELSPLKSEEAERVKHYDPDQWATEFIERRDVTIGLMGRRLSRAGRRLNRKLANQKLDSESAVSRLDENIRETFQVYVESDVPPDLEAVQALLTSSEETAASLLSRSEGKLLENVYLAARQTYAYITVASDRSGSLGTMAKPRKLGNTLKNRLVEVRELNRSIDGVYNLGTHSHRTLIKSIRVQRAREAVRLIDDIDAAAREMPATDQLETDKLGGALAVGRYLTAQLDLAKSVIKNVDPTFLGRGEIQDKLKRLGALSLAAASAERRLTGSSPEAEAIRLDITEARDVLRGGRRLKPAKGQTEREIQQKADALHALKSEKAEGQQRFLEPEENGIIMSVVTGRFNGFVEVLEKLRAMDGNTSLGSIPVERRTVIQQLRRFDLNDSLAKIKNQLDDPARSPCFSRILGYEGVSMVEATLQQSLKRENL